MDTAIWFDLSLAWLPGAIWGSMIGFFGATYGVFMSSSVRSKRFAKVLRYGYWGLIAGSIIFLMLALIALIVGQPYSIWYPLLIPGMVGIAVLGSLCYIPRTLARIESGAEQGEGGNSE